MYYTEEAASYLNLDDIIQQQALKSTQMFSSLHW